MATGVTGVEETILAELKQMQDMTEAFMGKILKLKVLVTKLDLDRVRAARLVAPVSPEQADHTAPTADEEQGHRDRLSCSTKILDAFYDLGDDKLTTLLWQIKTLYPTFLRESDNVRDRTTIVTTLCERASPRGALAMVVAGLRQMNYNHNANKLANSIL